MLRAPRGRRRMVLCVHALRAGHTHTRATRTCTHHAHLLAPRAHARTTQEAVALDPRNPLARYEKAGVLAAGGSDAGAAAALAELAALARIAPGEASVYFQVCACVRAGGAGAWLRPWRGACGPGACHEWASCCCAAPALHWPRVSGLCCTAPQMGKLYKRLGDLGAAQRQLEHALCLTSSASSSDAGLIKAAIEKLSMNDDEEEEEL